MRDLVTRILMLEIKIFNLFWRLQQMVIILRRSGCNVFFWEKIFPVWSPYNKFNSYHRNGNSCNKIVSWKKNTKNGKLRVFRWLTSLCCDNGNLSHQQQRFNQILSFIWHFILLELLDIELMVYLIITACDLCNFCISHHDFEYYFLDNDDSEDDGCVGLNRCVLGGPGSVRLAEAKRLKLMNINIIC